MKPQLVVWVLEHLQICEGYYQLLVSVSLFNTLLLGPPLRWHTEPVGTLTSSPGVHTIGSLLNRVGLYTGLYVYQFQTDLCIQPCGLALPNCKHNCPEPCHSAILVKVQQQVCLCIRYFVVFLLLDFGRFKRFICLPVPYWK